MAFGYETSHKTVKTQLYITITSHISETIRQNVQLQKIHCL